MGLEFAQRIRAAGVTVDELPEDLNRHRDEVDRRWKASLALLLGILAARPIAAQAPVSSPAPSGVALPILLPLAGPDTEHLGYPLRTVDRLAVRRLLGGRFYDALDTVLTAYADSASRDYRLEYRLFDAYDAFGVAVPMLAPPLDEWVKLRPASAAALLARARFLIACGWQVRGGAYAKDTPQEQFAIANQLFGYAMGNLAAALRLAPNSLVAHDYLMIVAGYGGDWASSRRILDQGLKIQPYSFVLRATHMRVLTPRWGGSYEKMADFAAESAPYAARNPRIAALPGFADWDRGRVLEEDGQRAAAEQEYQEAIRLGDLPRFRYDRARLYIDAHRYAEALADLNRAVILSPQYDDALFERAIVEYELARAAADTARSALLAQAFRDADLAVTLDPMNGAYQALLKRYTDSIPEFAPSRGP